MAYEGLPGSVAQGDTGRTTLTNHGVLIGAGTAAITQLAAGTAGQMLQSGGASADPAYSTATFPATATGTGKVLIADGTNWIASTPTYPVTAGTSGHILTSDGTNWTSAVPATAGTVTSVSGTTNQVAVATGTTTPVISLVGPYTPATYTAHGVLIGEGTSSIVAATVGATGTVLAGSTGADPAFTATPTVTSLTLGSGTALNTYVQGTFTPVLNFGGATTGITYTTQTGKYTQIGNVVYVNIAITLTSKGSATGAATITGLPVAAAITGDILTATYNSNFSLTASYTVVGVYTTASSTNLSFVESGTGQTAAGLTNTNFGNTTSFFMNGFYFTS